MINGKEKYTRSYTSIWIKTINNMNKKNTDCAMNVIVNKICFPIGLGLLKHHCTRDLLYLRLYDQDKYSL